MFKQEETMKMSNIIPGVLCGCAMMLASPLCAATHDVASGATDTLSGLTESARTVKTGEGTLVLSGNNSLIGLQTSAGTLKINGGTTTITGSGGADASSATFAQGGGTTIVEGGAIVNVTGTGYSGNFGGELMVTNGTFDMTLGSGTGTHFLNGFTSSSASKLTIQDEGVFKTVTLRICQNGSSATTEDVGLFLNDGGKLYLTPPYYLDGGAGTRYGVVCYNGGTIYMNGSADAYLYRSGGPWATVKSYVKKGGFHIVNDAATITIDQPFLTGTGDTEPDGGVHLRSSNNKVIKLYGNFKNSTFKGGLWLEDKAFLQNFTGSDGAFGAIPSSPTNNIFIKGNVTIFAGNGSDNYTLHRNRNIAIDAGVITTIGANSSGTGFRIGGEISVLNDENSLTNTLLNIGGTWSGLVVFDPGEGRTNLLGRLHATRRLEIASGVTRVRSSFSKHIGTEAPFYLKGNGSSYNDFNGYLLVSGGTLVSCGEQYLEASDYAQMVISSGKISSLDDYAEYINGYATPASLTVENEGVFECYRIRVSQGNQSEINVNTGGVLRIGYMIMYGTYSGNINLNGGTIEAYSSSAITDNDGKTFIGGNGGTENWQNITCRVLAGGARFDTAGYSRRVNMPLVSAVEAGETDGGLTKLGVGTLTMTAVNTYNGPTRLEGGTLTFAATDGRPDGDIEFSAAALVACTNAASPLLWGINIGSFRAGCGLRVTECETLDSETWTGGWHTVARFNTAIPAMPSVTFVKSDGTVVSSENGWDGWTFRIGEGGMRLEFKRTRGTVLLIR